MKLRVVERSLPDPRRGARRVELNREFHRHTGLGRDTHTVGQRSWISGNRRVQLKRHDDIARLVCAIEHDSAGLQSIRDVGETRQGRFNHQGLVDLEARRTAAELARARVGHSHEPIAGEVVRRGETRAHPAFTIRQQRSAPEGAGQKIFSQSLAPAASDEEALVPELEPLGIFGEEMRKRQP